MTWRGRLFAGEVKSHQRGLNVFRRPCMALQHRPPKTEELAMLLQSGSAMMGPGVRFTVHSSDLAHTSEAQRLSFLVFSQPCWRRAVRETPSENFIQSDDDVRARQLSSETDNHHQPAGARQQEEELVVEQQPVKTSVTAFRIIDAKICFLSFARTAVPLRSSRFGRLTSAAEPVTPVWVARRHRRSRPPAVSQSLCVDQSIMLFFSPPRVVTTCRSRGGARAGGAGARVSIHSLFPATQCRSFFNADEQGHCD